MKNGFDIVESIENILSYSADTICYKNIKKLLNAIDKHYEFWIIYTIGNPILIVEFSGIEDLYFKNSVLIKLNNFTVKILK